MMLVNDLLLCGSHLRYNNILGGKEIKLFIQDSRSGWISHLWFGFGKFPLKTSNFLIFSLRVKKISSGSVKKYLRQRQVSLLFTAGQKYVRVG